MTQVSLEALIAGAIAGNVVSFPTDTVPALAVKPNFSEAIFAAKGRSKEKPLILMGASLEQLLPYIQTTPEAFEVWQGIAQQYWPGSLTLVLPASEKLPPEINPTDPTTIGVRIPNQPTALKILSQTGPLATTSANRSGEPPLRTMKAIDAAFPSVLTLEEEEAVKGSGVPSTVAKWTGTGWEILRQGSIFLS
ncbi:MAG: L-threonylcarbamoyladenylate synthase [Chroococcales cyanobacterium]